MEVTNQTVLNAAKQRIHELEDELLPYKIMCTQQAIEIENYKKIIGELSKKMEELELKETIKNISCKDNKK